MAGVKRERTEYAPSRAQKAGGHVIEKSRYRRLDICTWTARLFGDREWLCRY